MLLNIFLNKKNQGILSLFLISLFCLFPLIINATEVTWPSVPKPGGGQITITNTTTLPELVSYLFTFSVMIAGLAAFSMLVYGGLRYLTSAGNAATQKDARDTITSAIVGLLLLLGSYLLLQLINPDILILKPLNV
ncbi:MAG: hypothetical protein WC514_01295 [Candidatus Paceibacterota bacterium]